MGKNNKDSRKMNINSISSSLQFTVSAELATDLAMHSGEWGEYADSEITRTPDGKLFINGYVWAGLIRRALMRLKGTEELVNIIGKNNAEWGISPLLCECSYADIQVTDIRPGIRVDEEYGAVTPGGLYNDEVLPKGHLISFYFQYLLKNEEKADEIEEKLKQALWVIHSGIETIGGDGSYGYGKLCIHDISTRVLKFTDSCDRKKFFTFPEKNTQNNLPWEKEGFVRPELSKGWKRIQVEAEIKPGQMLSISTAIPPLQPQGNTDVSPPDSYVLRTPEIKRGFSMPGIRVKDRIDESITITGKALRQAIFRKEITRWMNTVKGEAGNVTNWFGKSESQGIISISDARVKNDKTCVVHRIQLCEHSMQNNNLFSGEFLTKGTFTFDIMIDTSRGNDHAILLEKVKTILDELKESDDHPPGWYRVGGTSACTGQFTVNDYKEMSNE